jgi:acyl-coenzyme A synthetase/AMP-(fatty) acid ligase
MTAILRLRPLFMAGGAHHQLLSARGPVTANQLRDQALTLAAALQARPEQRWALWLTDTGEFLISFMALVLAGKTLCLPGNMQPATASALSRHFDALISRTAFADLACATVTPSQLQAAAAADLPAFEPQVEGDIELVLFTSGSTGEPKAIAKSLDLLERELHTLQAFAGEQLGQQPVLSTVSHQHIYGLLHLVLWPLLRRAPIVDGVFQYPEEMLASAVQYAPVTLLSSPTHLKRLPENPEFLQYHKDFLRRLARQRGRP